MTPPTELMEHFREAQAMLPAERLPSERQLREKLAAYDGEIFFFDQSLGALLARLKELGLYDEMVIAFVSDHGLPFNEHGVDQHGLKLHNEDTHVPLVLKLRGRQGEIDSTVSTIDLYPTLAGALGLALPPGLQGVSLFDRLEERKVRGAFSESTVRVHNHRSLITHDGRKLILDFDKFAHEEMMEEDEKGVVGLYLSRPDYRERWPIRDEQTTAQLRGRLWETYRESLEINRRVTPAHAEIGPETIEELRKIGYVE